MKLEIFLNVLNIILILTVIGVYLIVVSFYKKRLKTLDDQILNLSNYTAKLFFLLDVLAEATPPPTQVIYRQFRNLALDKLPKNRREEFEFFKELAMKQFLDNRVIFLGALNNEEDPIKKQELHGHLVEVDNMIDLLSTIGKDTSEEYMETVLIDLLTSIQKFKPME